MFNIRKILKQETLTRFYSLTASTKTSLSSTFNQRPTRKVNLSIINEDTGLFGWQKLQTPEGKGIPLQALKTTY